jgi:hypothetical protein
MMKRSKLTINGLTTFETVIHAP